MKTISINGHVLECPLMIDDPDVKRTFRDASGQPRHVRYFSQPGRLKSYIRKHPEGLILAGTGALFFTEPVPVSSASVRFGEDGSVDILLRDGAERVEKQLVAMEEIRAAAADAAGITNGNSEN